MGEKIIYSAKINPNPPQIESVNINRVDNNMLQISWKAPVIKGITYNIVGLTMSGMRYTIAKGLDKLTYDIAIDQIQTRAISRIIVVASDGVRSKEIESEDLNLAKDETKVFILSPKEEAHTLRTTHISFRILPETKRSSLSCRKDCLAFRRYSH
jgi:hypothetical protein